MCHRRERVANAADGVARLVGHAIAIFERLLLLARCGR